MHLHKNNELAIRILFMVETELRQKSNKTADLVMFPYFW